MGGLPDQKEKETYTASEVQHVVAREVMKHRLSDLERMLDAHGKRTDEMFKDVSAQLAKIEAAITSSYEHTSAAATSLRSEIERDFASKLDLQELRAEFKVFATRIVTAVVVASAVVQTLFEYLV